MLTLCDQRALLARAIRAPIGTTPGAPGSAPEEPEVLSRPVTAAAAGDNILIEAQPGTVELLQLILWNAAAQDLVFLNGPTLLQAIPAFPGPSGYELPFAPGLTPYFKISQGNPFILNLSAGTRVDGFLNYRVRG